ncbi:hypothetical protein CMV_009265 [Castanea mollissima]|uniref:Uncharacterized protein n=1 Tax=Castanea mollissima TaxID=60419 RepID=A0A8J4VNB8_9ROSI|nr:hypothetical protein CMV_009265 [Castanea mollissima]
MASKSQHAVPYVLILILFESQCFLIWIQSDGFHAEDAKKLFFKPVSGKVDNGKAPNILFLQHPSIINYLNLLSLFTGTFCAATSCTFTSKGGLTSYLYSCFCFGCLFAIFEEAC